MRNLGFARNFWVVNFMEMLERLAYFSVRAVLPLWMVATADQHGLGISFTEKGIIFMVWAAFQSFIPLFSGAFTDNYGYKRSLYVAFFINIIGYILMANASSFLSMLIASIFVGTGTAIFKPPVQGTVAMSVNDDNSSLGFGIFYWIVNIGGFLAPMLASLLRGSEAAGYTWHYVFYSAAIITALNYLPTIFFFEEPERKVGKTAAKVWSDIKEALSDKDFMIFLLIFSGFWLMFMQLWDLLPNFISQWIDSRALGSYLPDFMKDGDNVKAEQIININAFCIMAFMVPWSYVTGKFPRLVAITIGILMTTVAFLGSGLFLSGTMVALMIVLFSFGEMTCSPKFSEYIGVNAPKEKKALYMGLSNIPFAIGWILGNGISGPLYDMFSNKMMIARDYLQTTLGFSSAKLAEIVTTYKSENPDNLAKSTIDSLTIENFNYFDYLVQHLGKDAYQVNEILWNAYNPWIIWVILSSFGVVTIISMWIFSGVKKRKAANA